jgi:hypothetical protein
MTNKSKGSRAPSEPSGDDLHGVFRMPLAQDKLSRLNKMPGVGGAIDRYRQALEGVLSNLKQGDDASEPLSLLLGAVGNIGLLAPDEQPIFERHSNRVLQAVRNETHRRRFKPGDAVFCLDFGQMGTVLEQGGRLLIQLEDEQNVRDVRWDRVVAVPEDFRKSLLSFHNARIRLDRAVFTLDRKEVPPGDYMLRLDGGHVLLDATRGDRATIRYRINPLALLSVVRNSAAVEAAAGAVPETMKAAISRSPEGKPEALQRDVEKIVAFSYGAPALADGAVAIHGVDISAIRKAFDRLREAGCAVREEADHSFVISRGGETVRYAIRPPTAAEAERLRQLDGRRVVLLYGLSAVDGRSIDASIAYTFRRASNGHCLLIPDGGAPLELTRDKTSSVFAVGEWVLQESDDLVGTVVIGGSPNRAMLRLGAGGPVEARAIRPFTDKERAALALIDKRVRVGGRALTLEEERIEEGVVVDLDDLDDGQLAWEDDAQDEEDVLGHPQAGTARGPVAERDDGIIPEGEYTLRIRNGRLLLEDAAGSQIRIGMQALGMLRAA